MKKLLKFREIELKDVYRVLEIYNFHIKNSLTNFEEEPFNYNDFLNLIKFINKNDLPFLVCEEYDYIVGFAYLNKFRAKSGYKYTFENSIYIDNKHINKGIGSKLLYELIKCSLNNSQIKTIVAVIGDKKPEASIKIHKKNGFEMMGKLKKVGFKKNQWLDTIFMQIIIR